MSTTMGHATSEHLMNNYGQRALKMVRGQGMYLFDDKGRSYLDFTAGIAVCGLGHAHPVITEVITQQAATLVHCSNLYENNHQNALAAKLCKLSGLGKAFFCNSGTEANEAAMKLARKYAAARGDVNRTKIVSLPGGFHGRTLGALSITAKPAYQAGFTPLVPSCETPASFDDILANIDETTAACFVEIIQGEGGVRPVDGTLLKQIEKRCRETGALLVVDEVQTGVGRTGTFFAYQGASLAPDIVTMAKALANGVPAGAILAKTEVAEAFTAGSHGSTFGGNPLAMAVGNAVVDTVSADSFLDHVREMGAYLESVLKRYGADVSGRGLMWGMTVSNNKEYVASAMRHGLLLTSVGSSRVRLVPPLIVEQKHIDELEECLKQIAAGA